MAKPLSIMQPDIAVARTLITDLPTSLDHQPPGTMAAVDSPVHTTMSKVGRGLAASLMTTVVLLCLLLLAIPFYMIMLNSILPKVVDVNAPLFFDFRLPEPAATMQLLPPELRSKAYDYAEQEKPLKKYPRVFTPGQLYDVKVRLDLPDSEQNIEVGMFQVTVQLLSARGDVVAATTQPAMLHYRSQLVKLARLAAMAIPLVFNFLEERQVLKLHMLKGYQEGPVPVIAVRVLLEPSAGRPPGTGLPQVYSAEAEVKTRLTGLVSLLYHWRFTSLVWGPFVIFMWELAVAILCCPGLVLPGFMRKQTPALARPPIAEPVVTAAPDLEEALLQTGAAVVGDVDAVDIDALPKELANGLNRTANGSTADNEEHTASESESDLIGNGRASIGMGVEIGPQHRRKSTGKSGKRLSKGLLDEEPEKSVTFEDEEWNENMEKALEDILEVHVSPEESEVSEISSYEEIDAEMPPLEDGEVNKFLEDGANDLEPEEVEEVSENVLSAQEEADLLQEDGKASRLNELLNVDAESSPNGLRKETNTSLDRKSSARSEGDVKTSSTAGETVGLAGISEKSEGGRAKLTPRRSLSLDSGKAASPNGVNKPNHKSVETVQEESKEPGTNGVSSGSVADSPRTGVYSRFRGKGVRPSSSSGSLSDQSPEKNGKSPVYSQEEGSEAQASSSLKREPEEGEFKDALDTLTPSVSNASMQSALDTNEWRELSAEELETLGNERGPDDTVLDISGAPGPIEGGLRRRGTGKKGDE